MSILTRGLGTTTSVTVGATPVMSVLPQNNSRQFLLIQNVGTSANVYYSFDAVTPAVHTAGSFELTAGQAVLLDAYVMSNQLNVVADTAATPVSIFSLE